MPMWYHNTYSRCQHSYLDEDQLYETELSNLILNSTCIGSKKKKKVKCTLVQALRLCTGRMAHRGSRGIALLFHDHCTRRAGWMAHKGSRGIALLFHDYGTRRGWGLSVMPQLLFTLRKGWVYIVQDAGWAPGQVWTGAENLTPTGIQSLDRPARGQSLYRLSYPGPCV